MKNITNLTWDKISSYPLSLKFIHKFKDKLNWDKICRLQNLTEEFIEQHKNYIKWDLIQLYQNLSCEFIEKYIDKFNLKVIARSQKLSYEFINKYKDKLNLTTLLYFQKLEEKFLIDHENEIDNIINGWTLVCINQKLSMNFIKKYEHKLHPKLISRFQDLDPEYIIKNINKLSIPNLILNEYKPLSKLTKAQKITLVSQIKNKKDKEKLISYFNNKKENLHPPQITSLHILGKAKYPLIKAFVKHKILNLLYDMCLIYDLNLLNNTIIFEFEIVKETRIYNKVRRYYSGNIIAHCNLEHFIFNELEQKFVSQDLINILNNNYNTYVNLLLFRLEKIMTIKHIQNSSISFRELYNNPFYYVIE